MELESKVVKIIAEKLNKPEVEVTPEKRFQEDLGADSLERVEVVMALEEAFGMEIPEAEAEKIKTVGEAISFIKTKQ